jgi:hypothetical protein
MTLFVNVNPAVIFICEAFRPQSGASVEVTSFYIVPLDPTCPTLAGWGMFRSRSGKDSVVSFHINCPWPLCHSQTMKTDFQRTRNTDTVTLFSK